MTKTKSRRKGRSISKLKRNLQKRNKLVKQGKLKPKSTNTWIQAQERKKLKNKVKHHKDDEDPQKIPEEPEQESSDEEEGMDMEDAILLRGLGRNQALGEGKGSQKLSKQETEALKRYEQEGMVSKEQRGLLPIKTKKGLVVKTMDVEENEEDGDQEMEEEEVEEEEEEASLVNGRGQERTVLSLLSEREETLEELKTQIGSMATSFLEDPEERMYLLEKLVQMIDKQAVHVRHVGFKLVSTTVGELLKDVIPNYKIAHHNQENSLQKKDTRKLQNFENSILTCAKNYLMKLEKVLKRQKIYDDSHSAIHALRCLCDVLVTHPQFNYATNIIKLVMPYMDIRSNVASDVVKTAFEQVFRADRRGEVSLDAVKHMKNYIKSKKYACRPKMIETFLCLKLNYVEKESVEEDKKKGKKHKKELSKKEKKRQKQLEKVEKELLEARGEESRQLRNKNFTETSKIVFELLFRIVKSNEEHANLLPPALKCISKFCHVINVDFFDDLLRVLSLLVREGDLRPQEKLLCVKTAFDVLTGPGEFLTYDPGMFTKCLYDMLPSVYLIREPDTSEVICSIVRKMIIKRKKLVSKDLVHAFAKSLAFVSLQLPAEEAVIYLETLNAIKTCHLRTFEALLESEEHIPSKVMSFGHGDMDVGTFSLWEINLLRSHYEKAVVDTSKKISVKHD